MQRTRADHLRPEEHQGRGWCLEVQRPADHFAQGPWVRAFVSLHANDAAWANVIPEADVPDAELWAGEHQVAPQLGTLILLVDVSCLLRQGGKFSILEWKSKASHRVRQSTFAGETWHVERHWKVPCFCEVCYYLSFTTTHLVPSEIGGRQFPLHLVTDCWSYSSRRHATGAQGETSSRRLGRNPTAHWRLSPVAKMLAKRPWGHLCIGCHNRKPISSRTKHLKADDWWQRLSCGELSLPSRRHAEGVDNLEIFIPMWKHSFAKFPGT